jgi:hypothetical protein
VRGASVTVILLCAACSTRAPGGSRRDAGDDAGALDAGALDAPGPDTPSGDAPAGDAPALDACATDRCEPACTTDADCDDGDACTTDRCDGALGCAHALVDADGDGHAPSSLGAACDDCDDDDPAVRPGASESCNGVDDDCSGAADDPFECSGEGETRCGTCPPGQVQACTATCTLGACTVFTSRLFDDTVTPFTHDCGFDCGSGDWCLLGAPSGGCDLVSGGPGIALPAGSYEVEIYFGDVGTFRFTALDGVTELATATYTSVAGEFPRVVLRFAVPACADLHLRVRGETDARIRLYSVTVRRTA